jgi:uncharacterized protein with HEPN domain
MRARIGDKIRLLHIIDAMNEIEMYVKNIDTEAFLNNSMMRFACIKQLEIIGEACNLISKETQAKHNSINWPQIIGMRNVFVHEYFGIDSKLVWEIIKNDLPILKDHINNCLKDFKN